MTILAAARNRLWARNCFLNRKLKAYFSIYPYLLSDTMVGLTRIKAADVQIPKLTARIYNQWRELITPVWRKRYMGYVDGDVKKPTDLSQQQIWTENDAIAVSLLSLRYQMLNLVMWWVSMTRREYRTHWEDPSARRYRKASEFDSRIYQVQTVRHVN